MVLWLQWLICGLIGAAAVYYLARQWGLIPQRRKPKGACGCAKCPIAAETVKQMENALPRPRRRSIR
jgi:hypothetical protein